jgi:glucose/arabinose dehydrogenase/cytochrome c2
MSLPRSIPIAAMIGIATILSVPMGSLAASAPAADPIEEGARYSDRTQPYWVEQVASGLKFPSAMAWLPDDDILILEREGRVRIVHDGAVDPRPLPGAPASFHNAYNGLKDIALDPDFRINHNLYLLISEGSYERHHAAVFRARYSAAGLVDLTRIFRSSDEMEGVGPCAGRMMFLADKTLLIAVSEDDSHKQMAQRLDSDIGKMVRINRDGSTPQDNPFLKIPGARPEIWSYGHRVPTGLYQDPQTGTIWEAEAGPLGGDKLNVLKAGGNFGWAKASWGFNYEGGAAAPMQAGPGIEDPILIWMPSQDPAGLTQYRGSVYPLWDGDFFVGHLPNKELERVRVDGRHVMLQEKMLTDLAERIRDVKVGPDNHIYILTDHPNGRLLRLNPGRPHGDEVKRVAGKLDGGWHWDPSADFARLMPGDPQKGKQAFTERCSGCHSVGSVIQGGHIGPDLHAVVGRRAGSRADFKYSAALAGSPQVWGFVTLNLFIADPSRYAPGTAMSAPPVDDEEVRRDIVGFLLEESK